MTWWSLFIQTLYSCYTTSWDSTIKFSLGYFDAFRNDTVNVPELATLVERLGFDGMSVGHHSPGEFPSYETLTVLAYAAAATERIILSTSVLVLPLTHPVHLAQQIATLNILSEGRVILGVGAGGEAPKAFEAFGIPVS